MRRKIAPSKARAGFENKRFDRFFKKPYCLLANHNPEFRCVIALVLHFFALVLHFLHWCYTFLHSFLSQSESSNFFMYVISKFTRGIARERIMASLREVNRINPADVGLPENSSLERAAI